MIGHFQEPLDGSIERDDHEIAAQRHEIGRNEDMVDQRHPIVNVSGLICRRASSPA